MPTSSRRLRTLVFSKIVAGRGARLFKDGRAPKRLELADSKTTANGVAILTYHRVQQPAARLTAVRPVKRGPPVRA